MATGPGRLLAGRYRLGAQVGQGGMGIVWHAHDDLLDRDVAVKEVLCPAELNASEQQAVFRRTEREARAAARLNHPAAVTVFDVVEEDGRPWIVMEFVRARSLAQTVEDDGPLPPSQAARIGLEVLAALTAAHAAGILHRDVKPGNVLLAADSRVVLTDFGIAALHGDDTLTASGAVMGSPAYIAPERARGAPAEPASDLWSLGVTLYAAVEGRTPHERGGPLPTLLAVANEEPDPPQRAGPLAPVLDGLLRRDPAHRLSADDTARLLRTAAAEPDDAARPDVPRRPGPISPAVRAPGCSGCRAVRLPSPAPSPPPSRRGPARQLAVRSQPAGTGHRPVAATNVPGGTGRKAPRRRYVALARRARGARARGADRRRAAHARADEPPSPLPGGLSRFRRGGVGQVPGHGLRRSRGVGLAQFRRSGFLGSSGSSGPSPSPAGTTSTGSATPQSTATTSAASQSHGRAGSPGLEVQEDQESSHSSRRP